MQGDALVIGLAKKVKPSGKSNGKADDADTAEEEGATTDAAEGEGSSLDDVEQSAAADLADAIGADSDKVGAIKDALRDFVEACIKRQAKGEY